MSTNTPSDFLTATRTRWAHRGILVRRDLDMVLESLSVKSHFLESLRGKITEHRRDDLAQLKNAHEEASSRWAEQLTRVKQWQSAAAGLASPAARLVAWRDHAGWVKRAQSASARYQASLLRLVDRLEKQLNEATGRLQQWSDRLVLKEMELKEVLQRLPQDATEILVSSARKRPFLDFIFLEREEEGRLAFALKMIAKEAGQAMARLARLESAVIKKADSYPTYYEISGRQILGDWKPFQIRLSTLSQQTLNRGIPFEESRQRLRAIYEVVQRMRVVQEISPEPRKPLLYRLFNVQDE